MPRQCASSASVGLRKTSPFGQTASGNSSIETSKRSSNAAASRSLVGSRTVLGIPLRDRKPCKRTKSRSPAAPRSMGPPAPLWIRLTRRRMKARIINSPISALPTTSARSAAALSGTTVHPSAPTLASARAGRPESAPISPEICPAPCVVIIPEAPNASRRLTSRVPATIR